MAKIQRTTQKIFGDGAIQTQFTQFGTAKTADPVYTKNLDSLQGGEFAGGWAGAVLSDYAPYMEDLNGYMYMVTTQLAYILQQGAAIEYDAGTTYYVGSIVSDGAGNWYKCINAGQNGITGVNITNTTYWEKVELSKNGTPLFTQITTDYVLSGNDAVGWAMQGSQVSNSNYPTAYAKILALYNAGTSITYRGISAKRASDGRIIADISQQSAINTLFSTTGVSDFYILNSNAQYFYLPKTTRFIQYTTDTSTVNNFNDSGLPDLQQSITATTASNGTHTHSRGTMNITGRLPGENTGETAWWNRCSGAFYQGSTTNNKRGNSGLNDDNTDMYFDASRSWTGATSSAGAHTHTVNVTNSIGNQVYGRSLIVQPPASLKLLYYRVGDTAV